MITLYELKGKAGPLYSLFSWRQPFVCGAAPAYADYIAFSVFQWARVMSPHKVLADDDPVATWRERILDLHSGFARNVPVA